MTTPAVKPRSSAWQAIDASPTPAAFVAYLDELERAAGAGPLESLVLLGLGPGSAALDVGCGAGSSAIHLGRLVGPTGRAVGLDPSATMLATARARAEALDVRVEFVAGEAHALEFPDATFDAVHCDRVLQHLDDPETAVTEMARVLVGGGRLVIKEPDWDGLFVDADDPSTTRAVRDSIEAEIRQPNVGRRLRRLALAAGLDVVDFQGAIGVYAVARDAADRIWGLRDAVARAVTTGTVDPTAARAWWDDLGARDDAGRFFAGVVGFRVVARKPAVWGPAEAGR